MSLLTYAETGPGPRRTTPARCRPGTSTGTSASRGSSNRSLSDAEIATLAAWVDGGAPRGNPADMPPPVEFADRDQWHIGEPDWIVPLPEPFVVAAEAPNWWGDFFADSGLTEDRWIKAVETKPSAEGGGPPRRDAAAADGGRRRGRFPERVRTGEERRRVSRRHRPRDQGGLDHPLQHALRLGRPRGHRPDQRRPDVLPQGGDEARAVLERPAQLRPRHTAARTRYGTTATIVSTRMCD